MTATLNRHAGARPRTQPPAHQRRTRRVAAIRVGRWSAVVYGAPETVVPVLLAVAAICSPEGRGRFRVPLGQVGDVTAALESAGVTVTVRARRHPVPVCDTDEFDDCIRLLTEMLGASPVTSSASPVTSSDVVPTSSDEVQPEELTA